MTYLKITNLKLGLIAAAFALVALTGCGRGSDDEVHDFFEHIAHGDQSEASAQFSPELHRKFSEDMIDDAILNWTREILKHGGLKDIDISGGDLSYNKFALYDVVLTYEDGETKALKTSLIRTDDKWYINSAL